ncbi:uncharacterized protein SAPINGB_P001686 [Magnusiomyces paraingens]|uniref:Autophagy-related protein 3 n=1 Tax=Magnusiomyces paraingens TaxID=2606893 RepID=A0A5E8B761_9ASCO|nr:uncharacterized protein SAPINGB_P001686 [Saprochaete ingens]VVT47388.1 unnamed protein product [Saprochaete ingens]
MFRSTLSSLREYITPVSHVSTFRDTGEITPEEFVQAGDYLVYKFPTWSWAAAPPSKRRAFLPPDKQYLVTKHVPSRYRAATYESVDTKLEALDDDPDGWTATSFAKSDSDTPNASISTTTTTTTNAQEATAPISASPAAAAAPPPPSEEEIIDIEDIDDEDEEDENTFIPPDPGAGTSSGAGAPTSSITSPPGSADSSDRSYNLYITYSTSYRVPKLYLSGFSANGTPLSPDEMFEDIMADYRNKTATIEKAPFEEDLTSVSIHPCRHASVMKTLLARSEARRIQKLQESAAAAAAASSSGVHPSAEADAGSSSAAQPKQGEPSAPADDDWEEIDESDSQAALRVDQYLVVFLKFISSVTPGIEHDNTMSVL